VGDEVLHIELTRWTDALLVAPLSANTAAKVANGLRDNLVTSLLRAWDPAKPQLAAPAMSAGMWAHALTAPTLATLQQLRLRVMPPGRAQGPPPWQVAAGAAEADCVTSADDIVAAATQMLEGLRG